MILHNNLDLAVEGTVQEGEFHDESSNLWKEERAEKRFYFRRHKFAELGVGYYTILGLD